MAVLSTAFIIAYFLILTYLYKMNPKINPPLETILHHQFFSFIFIGIIIVILLCSVVKIFLLSGGGKHIAKMVGAFPVDLTTSDLQIKKYINVVEEMALASGTPVPAIFMMERESSINAFAAGYEIDDAVIAVSRGAIDQLTRAELQGVVAHEFSHILNGDMKLNIKLMGYLFGLSALVEIGNFMLRSNRGRHLAASKKGNGLAGIGFIFFTCGSLGMFFAQLIKAAISRQREFLADASAVQFTRNPQGIGGALKKILTLEFGSEITLPRASEIGHLFFGEAVSTFFSFLATHPPLIERIKAIDRQLLDGIEVDSKNGEDRAQVDGHPALFNFAPVVGKVGRITRESVSSAQQLLQTIPVNIHDLGQKKEGAQILCYALFLDSNSEVQKLQQKYFEKTPQLWQEIVAIQIQLSSLGERYRLPLVDLAMPTLKTMTPAEDANFLKNCKSLVQADGKLSAREFILYELLWQSLNAHHAFFDKQFLPHELKQNCVTLLSFLLLLGKTQGSAEIYENAIKGLYGKSLPIGQVTSKTLGEITQAFARLRKAPISFKKKFLTACQQVIEGDKRITVQEYEFLRLVSATLLLPLPPLEITGK